MLARIPPVGSFPDAGACTSYAAKGGQHIPAEALQCLADGWKGRLPVLAQTRAARRSARRSRP